MTKVSEKSQTKQSCKTGVMHRFSYDWTLKDAVFTKDKGKVFSCFACLLVYYLYICGI
jgi:hypothetical protein